MMVIPLFVRSFVSFFLSSFLSFFFLSFFLFSLLRHAEDASRNNGKDKPYFASNRLMKFLSGTNKATKVINETAAAAAAAAADNDDDG